MSEEVQKSSGWIRGLVTGVLIGAGAALLLAPKRGEELREELAQNAADWKDKATGPGATLAERAQELKDRAAELGQTVAQKAQEYKAKGIDAVDDVVQNASDVADDATEHDAEESV